MMNLLVYFINDHQIIFIFTPWKYQRLCIWFKTEEKIAMKTIYLYSTAPDFNISRP